MSQVVVGPGWLNEQIVGLPNNSYKPITNTTWVRARLCKLPKGCTRLSAASDKVYQLLAHGRWFSPGIPASSSTKTGRHDISEILLKVALSTINQIKSINLLVIVLSVLLFTASEYLLVSSTSFYTLINQEHGVEPILHMYLKEETRLTTRTFMQILK